MDRKRVEGIEPSSLAWKAIALPLSYTRTEPSRPSTRASATPPGTVPIRPGQACGRRATGRSPPRSGRRRTPRHTWQWGVQDSNLRRNNPSDLQSDPFDRSGNSPRGRLIGHGRHDRRHETRAGTAWPPRGPGQRRMRGWCDVDVPEADASAGMLLFAGFRDLALEGGADRCGNGRRGYE